MIYKIDKNQLNMLTKVRPSKRLGWLGLGSTQMGLD